MGSEEGNAPFLPTPFPRWGTGEYLEVWGLRPHMPLDSKGVC